ncbi:MAG: response regulator [Candidatus Omnitrophica bacterium]|nr:response regulator [Candidatus Omnitrophota bacterium]MCM8790378.1 response regulator [Candidatus Omnitrophota bacterium]
MTKPVIVAIDDEAEFIDMLQNYFLPRGYDISVAIRGAKGIETIKEKKPDVVLMDLKMPGIDGDEVLKLLKSMQPSPKVIFVTAYDDGGKTRARLLQMGAYAYFDKPIASLKVLEETINEASKR